MDDIKTQNQTVGDHKTSRLNGRNRRITGWWRFGALSLLFSGTVLVAALVLYLALGGGVNESKYVKAKQFQAVFLNNGQVYFGRITNLSDKFARITDIFYLQNQSTQSQKKQDDDSVTLRKLGCELHGPNDEMLINRDQLIFWENLKDDSAVVKKIAEFKQQNPNGQECSSDSTQSQSTQQSQQ